MSIKKKSSVFITGFTLVEILVVFAIIGIISVFYVVNSRPNTAELLKMDTTSLAADIRYVRSMAATRATYNGTFPSSGYGIVFKNGKGLTKSWYKVYAGGSSLIKTVELSDKSFRLIDPNTPLELALNDTNQKSFYFKSENDISTNGLDVSPEGDYQIAIYYGDLVYYSKSKINIGRQTEDNFIWSNLAITYDSRAIECGNGIKEAGESCERFAVDDVTVVDAACFPEDSLNGDECQYSGCGDGVIAGDEQCEKNSSVPGTDYIIYQNLCPNAPVLGWCYECVSGNDCKGGEGLATSINCCQANPDPMRGTCTDCKWEDNSACFKQSKICYDEGDEPPTN